MLSNTARLFLHSLWDLCTQTDKKELKALGKSATIKQIQAQKDTKAGEKMKADNYIAVFDSGVGGISVLRELVKLMPNEKFLYFGDSANAPYGTRPAQQVRALTLDAAQMLYSRKIKALVVACNTATSVAIEDLRAQYPQCIIIGIEPALKVAVEQCASGRIGVMATPVTLRQEKFQKQLTRFARSSVTCIPAPGVVELIEAGCTEGIQMEQLLTSILAPYRGKLDALVLGCTHYPFVKKSIRKILGKQVMLFDGGAGTARETKRRLECAGLLHSGRGEVLVQNSAQTPALLQLCNDLLNHDL